MAIKVTLGEAKTQEEKPFPKLMQYSEGDRDFIILASVQDDIGNFIGVVVQSNYSGREIGVYYDCWNKKSFKDFTGTITLQNA